MNVDRLLRGFLIVLCAQIPLLALFIYLLFTGVGISDFAKLAKLDQSNQTDFTRLLEQRNQQLLTQMNTVVGQLNTKIATLEKRLADVSTNSGSGNQVSPQLEAFLASGGAEKVDNLAAQLELLNTQLAGVNTRVDELAEHYASISESDREKFNVLTRELEGLKNQVVAQESQLEAIGNLTQELLSKEFPALHAEAPKRQPVAELRFDADGWRVGHKAEWALEKVIREAKALGRNARINIYGFTVQNGPLNFSMALADKRARSVADVLRQKGIKNNPITIFVVPEYAAYRDPNSRKSGDKYHAVHIYVE